MLARKVERVQFISFSQHSYRIIVKTELKMAVSHRHADHLTTEIFYGVGNLVTPLLTLLLYSLNTCQFELCIIFWRNCTLIAGSLQCGKVKKMCHPHISITKTQGDNRSTISGVVFDFHENNIFD